MESDTDLAASLRKSSESTPLQSDQEEDSETNALNTARGFTFNVLNSEEYTGGIDDDPSLKMIQLQNAFESAKKKNERGLTLEDFEKAIVQTVGTGLTYQEIKIMFMKVDANCDGEVDWDEFSTYMLSEYEGKSYLIELLKEKSFPKEPRYIKVRNRDTIVQIVFIPKTLKGVAKQKIDYGKGRYAMLSRDGNFSLWSPTLKLVWSETIDLFADCYSSPWFTNMVTLFNVGMLAMSTTNCDILFYELTSIELKIRCHVMALENMITCMYCWVDSANQNNAKIFWGDTKGNVCALVLKHALDIQIFGPKTRKKNEYLKVTLSDVAGGKFPAIKYLRIPEIHNDWVSEIRYISEIYCFVSCSNHPDSSMYVGDLEGRHTTAYYRVMKGISCVDYSREYNVIITGGMDYCIRLWNPYLTIRPIAQIREHRLPICKVIVNSKLGQIISIDRGNTVYVFSLRDCSVVQCLLGGKVIRIGPVPATAVHFSTALNNFIIANNVLAVIGAKSRDDTFCEVVSHPRRVVGALYNKVFEVVVSACWGSVVCVWDVVSGEKIIQFVNAHSVKRQGLEESVEITAMTFDSSMRRLLTGAMNGTVKIWNFNNGACLEELSVRTGAVTGLLHVESQIFVVGWYRSVTVFATIEGQLIQHEWKVKHQSDILCIDFIPPHVVVTASYDGDIILWSHDTGQVYCRFNAYKCTGPISESKLSAGDSDPLPSTILQAVLPDRPLASRSDITTSDDMDPNEMSDEKPESEQGLPSEDKDVLLSHGLKDEATDRRTLFQSPTPESETYKHPLLTVVNEHKGGDDDFTRKEYDEVSGAYEAAIEKILILRKRRNNQHTAKMLTSGADGWVRAWSLHHEGGLLGQFNATHKGNHSVFALATDSANRYLFTGDTMGYVKVWDIEEYCTGSLKSNEQRKSSRHLKVKFPFLNNIMRMEQRGYYAKNLGLNEDKILPPESSRPDQTVKYPFMLNSFRVHTRSIHHIDYIDNRRLILTASDDRTIRLWTISGKYIGTFSETWELQDGKKLHKIKRRVPNDIRRVGSANTLRVLNEGEYPHWKHAMAVIHKHGLENLKRQLVHLQKRRPDSGAEPGSALPPPKLGSEILGKNYKEKVRHRLPPTVKPFYECSQKVHIYNSLHFTRLAPIVPAQPPKFIADIHHRRLMENTNQMVQGPADGNITNEETNALDMYYRILRHSGAVDCQAEVTEMKLLIDDMKSVQSHITEKSKVQRKSCESMVYRKKKH